MNYYFPSFLSLTDLRAQAAAHLPFTVNSGKNAIRLLLRKANLPKHANVLVPSYVCDSLKIAVHEEGLQVVYLDLKPGGSFWTDYLANDRRLATANAVILIHMYGFIHPDTPAIMKFCRENTIPLIHDAAQSYGIDEKQLTYSSGIVYSFGPGKSTTAAGGAIVKGLSAHEHMAYTKRTSARSLQEIKAQLFLKSRIYGYSFSKSERMTQRIVYYLQEKQKISTMSPFQKSAATAAMLLVDEKKEVRLRNYQHLKKAIKFQTAVDIAFDDDAGLYFKMILYVKTDVEHFKHYLHKNKIPFFSLADSLQVDNEQFENKKFFSLSAHRLVELSTEASIPEEEIVRIADALKNYSIG